MSPASRRSWVANGSSVTLDWRLPVGAPASASLSPARTDGHPSDWVADVANAASIDAGAQTSPPGQPPLRIGDASGSSGSRGVVSTHVVAGFTVAAAPVGAAFCLHPASGTTSATSSLTRRLSARRAALVDTRRGDAPRAPSSTVATLPAWLDDTRPSPGVSSSSASRRAAAATTPRRGPRQAAPAPPERRAVDHPRRAKRAARRPAEALERQAPRRPQAAQATAQQEPAERPAAERPAVARAPAARPRATLARPRAAPAAQQARASRRRSCSRSGSLTRWSARR